jgi:transposase-like protein
MANGLNLSTLAKHFSDETAARELLESMRWPNGPECPTCGQTETVYRMQAKAGSKRPGRPGLLRCRACKRQFTVTVGTIFEDSHIPLSKWLLAIHLLCSSKKGMSAHQFHRMLGVTYKSAWFMAHRLRYAMSQEPLASKLSGIVEADETYIGGKRKGMRGRPPAGDRKKTAVVALVERGGKVRAFTMPRVTAENVREAIVEHVAADARLMTDESNVYIGIGRQMGGHETVKHGLDEYVRGECHTNTVEGFFSLLKRGITGVYHHVGKGHVGRYVDEFSFRYDARKATDADRALMLVEGAEGKRLTHKQPAGASPSEPDVPF